MKTRSPPPPLSKVWILPKYTYKFSRLISIHFFEKISRESEVRRALGSVHVSTLLCIHDDCLHSIHKSVKDWWTDTSCYGEQEFIMDKMERQRILADLCTEELNDLKWKGVNNVQLRPAKIYALNHGALHILQ